MDSKQLESILIDVSSLTEENNHTLARATIASDILKDLKLLNVYNAIDELQSFYGYLDSKLSSIRNDIDKALYSKIESKFSAEISTKIIDCL